MERSTSVRLEADVQPFVTGFGKASKASTDLASTAEAASRRLKTSTDKMGRAGLDAGRGVANGMGTAETASRSLAQANERSMASYRASVDKAVKSTQAFASSAADSARKHQAAWQQVGQASLATGAIIGAGVGLSVKAFKDFDVAMSRAQAGTRTTGDTLSALRDAAVDAGAKTQFSATEAADAITAMGKAGVSAGDILNGGLNGALSLAAAGELEVGRAAEIAATAMSQFSLSGDQIPHVADLLAAGAGKAQGSVQQLADALKYVGPVASGMGVSIEETTGVLAMFAKAGIVGEQGGTAFRGVLSSLSSPSKVAAKEIENLGLRMYDAQGEFVGAQGAAGELQRVYKDMTGQQRDASLGVIFGNEQLTAARILYKGGAKDVANWTAQVDDAGYAAEQAAILTDNWSGDLERLGGSLSSVLIGTGSAADGVLRGMTQSLQGAVDTFGSLPDGAQKAAFWIGATGAAAATTGGLVMLALPKYLELVDSMKEMGLAGPKASSALRGLGVAAGVAGIAIPVATTAFQGLHSAVSDYLNLSGPGLSASTNSLIDFAKTGVATGELAKTFGADLGGVGRAVGELSGNSGKISAAANALDNLVLPLKAMPDINQKAAASLRDTDQALSQLVSAGQTEIAGDAFDRLAAGAKAGGYSVDDLRAKLPQYTDALAGVDAQAKLNAASGKLLADGTKVLADGTTIAADGTTVMTEAMKEAAETAEKWRTKLMDLAGGFVAPLSAYTETLDAKKAAEQAAAEATADATKSGKDSWEDYAKDVDVSMGEYLATLKKQVSAQQDWETNMLILSSRVSQGTLDQLAAMGKDGAPLVAEMVTATSGELKQLEPLWARSTAAATGAIADRLTNAGPVLQALAAKAGQKTVAGYSAKLVAGTATVEEIVQKYGLVIKENVPETRNTKFGTPGLPAATAQVHALGEEIFKLKDRTVSIGVATRAFELNPNTPATNPGVMRRAQGGLLRGPGTGTSDSILGIDPSTYQATAYVSNDEFVVNARDTAKHLPLLEDINAGRLPALKGGGMPSSSKVELEGSTTGSVVAALAPATSAMTNAAAALQQSARATATTAAAATGTAPGAGAAGGQGALVALGKWLQGQGARVSEHQSFGGVNGGHAPNSKHYAKPVSRAIDVNYGPGGQNATEMAKFDQLAPLIRSKGFQVLWRVAGHFNHLHAALAGGGLVGARSARPARYATGGVVRTAGSTAATEKARADAADRARAAVEANAQVRGNRQQVRFDAKTPAQQYADLTRQMAAERKYTDAWLALAAKRQAVIEQIRDKQGEAAKERNDQANEIASNRHEALFDGMTAAQQVMDIDKRMKSVKRFTDVWMQLAGQRRAITLSQRDAEEQAAKERADQSAEIAGNKREVLFDGMTPQQQVVDLDKRMKAHKKFSDEWMNLAGQRRQITLSQRAEEKAAADEAAAQAQEIAGNRQQVLFDGMTSDQQVADLDRRLRAVREYSTEWMQLTSQRAQIAGQVAADQARIAQNRADFDFAGKTPQQQVSDLDVRIRAEREYTDAWMQLVQQRQGIVDQIDATQRQADEDRRAADARLDANRDEFAFDHMGTAQQIDDLDRRRLAVRAYSDEWMQLTNQREQLAQQVADAERTRQDAAAQAAADRAAMLDTNRRQWTFDHLSREQQVGDLGAQLAAEEQYTDGWMRLTSQRQALLDAIDADAAPARERAAAMSTYAAGKALSVRNTAAFYKNLQTLADRGAAGLASALLEQSDDQAEAIAEQAVGASNSVLAGLNNDVGRAADLTKQREQLAAALKGTQTAQPAWSLPQMLAGIYGARPAAATQQKIYVQNPWTAEYHEARMSDIVDGQLTGVATGLVYGSR